VARKRTAPPDVHGTLKPCPCCGESRPYGWDGRRRKENGLYNGVMSAMTYGVSCRSCGLKMERQFPDRWPKGVGTLEELGVYTLAQAVEAWNARPA
jgi:hypothetical protein